MIGSSRWQVLALVAMALGIWLLVRASSLSVVPASDGTSHPSAQSRAGPRAGFMKRVHKSEMIRSVARRLRARLRPRLRMCS